MYKVCQCCPISPISLACWRSSGEGAEEVGCGRRRCGEGSGSWCCGCVCVCWKGPSWLPRCSAPGNRSPDPGTRAGEAALRGAWPLLVSSGPLQSPVPFELHRRGPVHGARPGLALDHQVMLPAKDKKIQIGDDNVTGFETTTGGLCSQSEPCQRRGTGR